MSRLARKLLGQVCRLNKEYGLVREGDRVMACLSGGKDSYAMLALLLEMRRIVPFGFEVVAVTLDQGHPGFPAERIRAWAAARGVPAHVLRQDTLSIVREHVPEGRTTCSLCSRLRRGILYRAAVELGCTRIALGHHRDDLIETLLLNLLYSGQIKAMPPLLVSDDGRNTVIRPLALCAEGDLAAYARELGCPIVPCSLCGSQETERVRVKRLLDDLERHNPRIRSNLLASLRNVRPTHLMDPRLPGAPGMEAPSSR